MRIVTSERARSDIQEIFAYIARDSVQNAATVIDRLVDAIDSLELFPNRARRGSIPGTRELVVDRTGCLIIYRVGPSDVVVLRVWHAARGKPRLD